MQKTHHVVQFQRATSEDQDRSRAGVPVNELVPEHIALLLGSFPQVDSRWGRRDQGDEEWSEGRELHIGECVWELWGGECVWKVRRAGLFGHELATGWKPDGSERKAIAWERPFIHITMQIIVYNPSIDHMQNLVRSSQAPRCRGNCTPCVVVSRVKRPRSTSSCPHTYQLRSLLRALRFIFIQIHPLQKPSVLFRYSRIVWCST